MPTAKATVTEVYPEQHQSKSVLWLETRVTDKFNGIGILLGYTTVGKQAEVQFVDNMALADLEAQCSGQATQVRV